MNKRRLDFAQAPDLSARPIIDALDPYVIGPMEVIPETLARAQMSLRFPVYGLDIAAVRHLTEPDALAVLEGFLRAALAEFVSMEETLKSELKLNSARRLYDYPNPLLHIMRELRNIEIHQRTGKLAQRSRDAVFSNTNDQITINIYTIDPITPQQFRNTKNAQYYDDSDIDALVAWFNNAQEQWGVAYLLVKAVNTFCNHIVEDYNLT